MKKVKLLSVLALVGFLAVSCATLSKPSLQYSNEQVAEFERAVTEDLNTPKKVNRWLFNNFAYDNDELRRIMSGTGPTGGLVFNHPIETYFNKWGVCCDAANFAGYCLTEAGCECVTIRAKHPDKVGHSVCAFKANNSWWIIGDTRDFSIRGPYRNFEDVALQITAGKSKAYTINKYQKGWQTLSPENVTAQRLDEDELKPEIVELVWPK